MKKILFVIIICVFYFTNYKKEDLSNYQSEEIKVEIKGEVVQPGSYTLAYASRLQDIIDAAGGVNKDADLSSININQILHDQDVVVITKVQEVSKVSINAASIEELCTLPGIGEVTAQKIITYREQVKTFQSLEDLMLVAGIKQKTFDALKEFICL